MENPEGRGVIRQIPFVGVVWLFSGTTQLQKELSIAFYPDLHVFVFFEIAEVYLRLAGCRVYEGHLQNERVIKTFQKHPKSSKFVCIDFSLRTTEDKHPKHRKHQAFLKKMPIRGRIRFRAKTIVTSSSRDIYISIDPKIIS